MSTRFVPVVTRLAALAACATVVGAALPASAGPFKKDELFVGRSIKQDPGDKTFMLGANFQVAPVKAIAKSLIKKAMDQAAANYPGGDKVLTLMQNVDQKQLDQINAASDQAAMFKQIIKQQAEANGVPITDEQMKAIDTVDAAKVKQLTQAVALLKEPESALTFSLEPWVEVNTKWVSMTAQVPIAGFKTDTDGTTLQLGNVNLDLKTGQSYGPNLAGVGWTVGVAAYAPSGTKDANAVALSNILATPKYLHEYFTYAPYAIIGAALPVITLQARGELVSMHKVRDDPTFDQIQYFNWGVSAIIDLFILNVTAELDGLAEVKNAPAMKGLIATLGTRFTLGPARLGVGVQLPVGQRETGAYAASFGGASFGDPAKVNVLINAGFSL